MAATESDMDGALTMQLLKHVTRGQPVLFADVRHYDEFRQLWYFSNPGMHPMFFAGASMRPEDNLKHVTFYPRSPIFQQEDRRCIISPPWQGDPCPDGAAQGKILHSVAYEGVH